MVTHTSIYVMLRSLLEFCLAYHSVPESCFVKCNGKTFLVLGSFKTQSSILMHFTKYDWSIFEVYF